MSLKTTLLFLPATWIVFHCILRTHASSNKVVSHLLKTIVDQRDPYHYNETIYNYRIGILPKFHALSIEFDLKITAPHRSHLRQYLLSLESQSARLSFYLNGDGRLGITHYNQQLDALGEDVNLLDGNPIHVPFFSMHAFNHFAIVIVDNKRIGVKIGENSIHRNIERTICPNNERMDIWLDRQGLQTADGVIKNLVITAS